MKFNRAWIPLNGLRAFESTARHLSFTKAAEELSVTQSAVSRQVQRLEELLGVKLLQRKNREIIMTPQGERLFSTASDSFDLLVRAMRDVVENDRQELLRICMAPSFAHTIGPKLVTGFASTYPTVRLEVDSRWSSSGIDTSDYDLCIVYSKPKITEHVMDLLWDEKVTPLCAPQLVEGVDVSDVEGFLRGNRLLHVRAEAGQFHTWETWARQFDMPLALVSRGVTFDTSILGVRCALEGGGVVMTDKRLYENEIQRGELVAPLQQQCHSGFGYHLLLRRDDLNNERIQQFRNWIVDQFKAVSND